MTPTSLPLAQALRATLLAVLVGLCSPVQALPKLDPAETCNGIARMTGSFDQNVYDQCLAKERQAYATIKTLWPVISAEVRTRCQGESDSYGHLANCLKREATSFARQFHFKF